MVQYIRTTFTSAKHNISINGMEAAEAEEPAGGEGASLQHPFPMSATEWNAGVF